MSLSKGTVKLDVSSVETVVKTRFVGLDFLQPPLTTVKLHHKRTADGTARRGFPAKPEDVSQIPGAHVPERTESQKFTFGGIYSKSLSLKMCKSITGISLRQNQ